MFVSPEEAIAVHEARHKLRSTRNNETWLFVPYMPSACFALGHYTDDGWKQCMEEGCLWHHRKLIPKAHVVALVIPKALPFSKFATTQLPKKVPYVVGDWEQKIVELTGGVLKPFNNAVTQPDQLAIVGRPPGAKNLPLQFRWLDSVLTGVPSDICQMSIPEVLPCIIKGQVALSATATPLDNPPTGRIKHKTPFRTIQVENRETA